MNRAQAQDPQDWAWKLLLLGPCTCTYLCQAGPSSEAANSAQAYNVDLPADIRVLAEEDITNLTHTSSSLL